MTEKKEAAQTSAQTIDREKLEGKGLGVCTPMYGGLCYCNYHDSMIDLAIHCTHLGLPFARMRTENESLIQRARNYCADKALNQPRVTHIMWIDADIGFDPYHVLQLLTMVGTSPLEDDYDVIAGTYPKKTIKWDHVHKAVLDGVPAHELQFHTGDFVFNRKSSGPFLINKPIEVNELGTGFMMVRKATLHRLIEEEIVPKYKPDDGHAGFPPEHEIGMFYHCDVNEKGRYLSEDYWFCQQVQKAGMKVWLAPWINCLHKGTYTFSGTLAAHRVPPPVEVQELQEATTDG